MALELNERTRRAIAASKRREQLIIAEDWRYVPFFEWLQFSPSYELARRYKAGEVIERLPADFSKVLETYERFGDVRNTYFYDWWVSVAQFQFALKQRPPVKLLAQARYSEILDDAQITATNKDVLGFLNNERLLMRLPPYALLAVPMNGNRHVIKEVTAQVVELLRQSTEVQTDLFQFEQNKIRKGTSDLARKVLRARAARPKAKLYVVGNLAKISRVNETDEKIPRKQVEHQRRQMEIYVSRHLNRAYLLAENAARGQFPSLQKLPPDPDRPSFDYAHLFRFLKQQIRQLEQWRSELNRR